MRALVLRPYKTVSLIYLFIHCSLRRAFKKSKSVHVVKEDEGLPSPVDVMDGSNEGGENLAAFLESIGLQSYHDAIKNELKVMY